MIQYAYQVRFNTPAFLGNVDQAGQWRTPPFKALLRQWWRVVNARNHQYDHTALRESEGDLFGNAWLTDARKRSLFRRSRVSLRLDPWDCGQLGNQAWPGGPMESVTTTVDGKGSVRADVYLGFGPVLPPSKKEGRSSVAIRQALAPGDEAVFRIMAEKSQQLTDALQLMAWFGTLGSRSRNGWGSFSLSAQHGSAELVPVPTPGHRLLSEIGRDWGQCLDRDWPHALGTENGVPLIWCTRPYENWRKAMGALANIKVATRRVAKAFVGPNRIGGIHLLGYPAGRHWELTEFKRGKPSRDDEEARLATQLRFKVCAVREGLVGIVFHLPHGFPKDLLRRLNSAQQSWVTEHQAKVWAGIHGALDQMPRLTRFGGTK